MLLRASGRDAFFFPAIFYAMPAKVQLFPLLDFLIKVPPGLLRKGFAILKALRKQKQKVTNNLQHAGNFRKFNSGVHMFTSIAYAAGNAGGAAAQQGPLGAFASLVPLLLMFAVFYFLLIRPQQKRQKEHKAMIEALGKGAYVMTSAGFLGRIVDIEGDILVVDLGETKVRMPRSFVSGTYDPKTLGKAETAEKK